MHLQKCHLKLYGNIITDVEICDNEFKIGDFAIIISRFVIVLIYTGMRILRFQRFFLQNVIFIFSTSVFILTDFILNI